MREDGDRIHSTIPSAGSTRRRDGLKRCGLVATECREVVGQRTDKASRIARTLVHYLGRIVGKENAMTAPQLARLCGVLDTGTCQPLREAAKILLVRHGIPIISCWKGFFVATTQQELYDYRQSLEHRMQGLGRDIEAVNSAITKMRMDEKKHIWQPTQKGLF